MKMLIFVLRWKKSLGSNFSIVKKKQFMQDILLVFICAGKLILVFPIM